MSTHSNALDAFRADYAPLFEEEKDKLKKRSCIFSEAIAITKEARAIAPGILQRDAIDFLARRAALTRLREIKPEYFE